MALQSSGQISLSNIATEKGASTSHISLASMNFSINNASPSKPNTSTPHAMSEWYGYDHNYSAAVTVTPINVRVTFGEQTPFGEAPSVCNLSDVITLYKSGTEGMPQQGDSVWLNEEGTDPYTFDSPEPVGYLGYLNPDFSVWVAFGITAGGNTVTEANAHICSAGGPPGRSERRLKYNIEYIADSPMGIPMYYFNYINEAHGKGRYVGTMVDDLQRLGFNDVLSTIDGEIFVNYSKIDVPFAQIED